MKKTRYKLSITILISIAVAACVSSLPGPNVVTKQTATCSDEVLKDIDQKVVTGDGQGHGPDIGTDEWHSVVEFKLNVRGDPSVPERNNLAWCAYIQGLL